MFFMASVRIVSIKGSLVNFIVGLCCIQHSLSFHPSPSRMSERIFSTDRHTSTSLSALAWRPLQDLIDTIDPSSICTANKEHSRLAKDTEYATAVLKAWREDASAYHASEKNVGSDFVYHQSKDGVELNGYLVAPPSLVEGGNPGQMKKEQVPAIILFHTGAGPQDIFLRWKADILVRELNCIVLIADIIADADGYAWSDREKYDAARKSVLAVSEEGGQIARWKLRRTIAAAINHLKHLDFIKIDNIAAMGYCMGGHPILELGLMQENSVKTLISYHGVFDGVKEYANESNDSGGTSSATNRTQVLICNGKMDPFVQENDIEKAKNLLEIKGCDVTILNFDGVKHGFTNPAQDYNPSDAFAFNDHAAKTSWDSTIQLLRQTL